MLFGSMSQEALEVWATDVPTSIWKERVLVISACFAASAPSASFASLQNAVVTFLSVAFSNSLSINCRYK
jgi:hypothetical protein